MADLSAALVVECVLVCLLVCPCRLSAAMDTSEEKTLAMIKPDGVSGNYTDAIKKTILDSGFSITQEMLLQLNEDMVKSFYEEHSEKCFFSNLVQYMTRSLGKNICCSSMRWRNSGIKLMRMLKYTRKRQRSGTVRESRRGNLSRETWFFYSTQD